MKYTCVRAALLVLQSYQSYLSPGIWLQVHSQCVGQTKLHIAIETFVSTRRTGSSLGGWVEVMWRERGEERERERE